MNNVGFSLQWMWMNWGNSVKVLINIWLNHIVQIIIYTILCIAIDLWAMSAISTSIFIVNVNNCRLSSLNASQLIGDVLYALHSGYFFRQDFFLFWFFVLSSQF